MKIKNISGEDRFVMRPEGRRFVRDGATLDVDDKEAKSYTVQDSVWAEVPAKKGDN